jgi:hypothetical protein
MSSIDSEIAGLALQSRQQRKISVKMPLKKILILFNTLREFDANVKSKRALYRTIGILLIFAGIIALGFEAAMIGLVLITIGLIMLIISSNYKPLDSPFEFNDYLSPVIDTLKDDIRQDADVALNIQLSKLDSPLFQDKIGPAKQIGIYQCTDYFYKRNFLTLKMTLYDGNSMFLTGNEFLRKQVRLRTVRKTKIKTKYVSRNSFTIRLRYDNTKFTHRKFIEADAKNKDFQLSVKNTPKGTILIMDFETRSKGGSFSLPDPGITLENMARLYSYLQPISNQNK